MLFRKRLKPTAMLMAGLASLALANLVHWFLARHTHISEDTVDFTSGLLMGIAIATLLLAIVRQKAGSRAP